MMFHFSNNTNSFASRSYQVAKSQLEDVEMVDVENRSPVDNNARYPNVLANNNARNIFVTSSTFTTSTFATNPFTRNNADSQDAERVDVENMMEIEVFKESPVDHYRQNVSVNNNTYNTFVANTLTSNTFTTNNFAVNPFTRNNNVDSEDTEMVDAENMMEL